ncbi:barstar family protein [Fulvivirga sp.]|uniref:barstar family protein n=1 Tax=Fulvivirga sp. TaxID=1931237 RepID=UPI0032EDB0E7
MSIAYIIDGAKFSSKNGFYDYVEKHFTQGLNYKIGRNLDALADVLGGGFGMHDCDEHIIIKWKNLEKSRKRLDPDFLNKVLEILEELEQVNFYKFDYKE